MVGIEMTTYKDYYPGSTHKTNYGKIRVTKYVNNREVHVIFVGTGYATKAQVVQLQRGEIKDPLVPNVSGVGYLGVGEYKSCKQGKITKEYRTWRDMLYRCYSGKEPCYDKVEVCQQWWNFQNFAEWYNKQRDSHKEGFELDKDILGNGTLYSPETCSLVTKEDNCKAARGTLGKKYTLKHKEYGIHSFDNQREFSRAWGLQHQNVGRVLRGVAKTHKGWFIP